MVKSVNVFFWPRDLDLETLKMLQCCKQQYNRRSSFVSSGNLTSADRLTLCRPIRNAECSVRWRKEFKKSQGVTFLPGPLPPTHPFSGSTSPQLSRICSSYFIGADSHRFAPFYGNGSDSSL